MKACDIHQSSTRRPSPPLAGAGRLNRMAQNLLPRAFREVAYRRKFIDNVDEHLFMGSYESFEAAAAAAPTSKPAGVRQRRGGPPAVQPEDLLLRLPGAVLDRPLVRGRLAFRVRPRRPCRHQVLRVPSRAQLPVGHALEDLRCRGRHPGRPRDRRRARHRRGTELHQRLQGSQRLRRAVHFGLPAVPARTHAPRSWPRCQSSRSASS